MLNKEIYIDTGTSVPILYLTIMFSIQIYDFIYNVIVYTYYTYTIEDII